jgi:MoaA/NifB/PqqE/SkfB family radical SAM enzyme
VTVLFLGGEPLLEFPLVERAVAHVRARAWGGRSIRFAVVTNGTLLREEQAAFLAAHAFDTHLSFDGVPAAQDARGKGTFAVLDTLLARLRRDQPAFWRECLTVAVTLTPSTVRHLPDSVAYFLRRRVPTVVLSPAITHDPGWTPGHIDEIEAAFARTYALCLRHYRRTGEVPLEIFRKSGDGAGTRGPRDAMCAAPTGHNLAVDVDGRVHGCAVFVESYQSFASAEVRRRVEALRLGDYRAPDFRRRLALYPEAARATGVFHAKAEKYSSYGRCGQCRFLAECSICPASIGNIPGNADARRVPDFPCAYNLVALEYRERFPRQPTPLDVLTGAVRAYGPLGRTQRRMLAAVGRRPATL